MGYSDVAKFEVQKDLAGRLGYKKIYVLGRDIELVRRPSGGEVPQIVLGRDPGTLINGLRDVNVIGIVFEGDELARMVVEKAHELKKTVFIPVGDLTRTGMNERGPKIGRLRKIIFSAHKLGASIRAVTLAESEIELLSVSQMKQVGKLLLKDGDNLDLLGDIL